MKKSKLEPKRKSIIRQRVIRVLLNHPDGNLTKYKVAQLSQSKYPAVHAFLTYLEKAGLVRGTKVMNFKDLIFLWQNIQIKPDARDYFITDPLKILRNTTLEYAITTYQAERMTQNYLFPSRTDFYIRPEDKIEWHKILSQEGLVGKGNTRILIGDEQAFYNSYAVDDLIVVSPPQLILDLLNEGGAAVEAANYMLERFSNNAISEL